MTDKKTLDRFIKYLNDNDVKIVRMNEDVIYKGKVIASKGWYTFDLDPALLSRGLEIMYDVIFDRELTLHFSVNYIYSNDLFW